MSHGVFEPSTVPIDVHYGRFHGASGVAEYEFFLRPKDHGNVDRQLAWLQTAYREVLDELGLAPESGVFRRFFCTDPRNQAPSFEEHAFSNPLNEAPPCAVSWVGQMSTCTPSGAQNKPRW